MSLAAWACWAALSGMLAARPLFAWADRRPGGGGAGRFSHCGRRGGWDWVPLGWWAARRGRCPQCGMRIPARGPLLEAACGGLWAATVLAIGASPVLPAYLWFASIALALAVIDLEQMRVPNRILFPGIAVGGALLAAGSLAAGESARLGEAAASGAGSFAVMLAAALLARGGLGYGDVKLAFLLGLFTGYAGWRWAALSLLAAFATGAVAGVLLMAAGKRTGGDLLAFGPFMAATAWLAAAAAGSPFWERIALA